MSNNKTSWLNLDDDDDLGGSPLSDAFTESIETKGATSDQTFDATVDQTNVQSGLGFSERRTVFEPDTEKTEIYHPGMAGDFDEKDEFDPMTDPIVGWLVVVKGPGIGKCVNLGAGMNTLGRHNNERVALAFGDTLISNNDHLRIIYDDANRAFFVAPGSGRNISRLNGQIVATTASLENYALIELSKQTHVRFVAFCNEAFDWSDTADQTD